MREVVVSLHDSRWLTGVDPLRRDRLPSEETQTATEQFEEFDPFRELEDGQQTRCSSCQCIVECEGQGRDALRAHYHSPWHRHNVRRVQHGRRVLSEEQFEDANGDDDVSSMSSNDEDEDSPDAWANTEGDSASSSRVFFSHEGHAFSLYRCLLHVGETWPSPSVFNRPLDASVFLLAGGHFAAAVFRGDAMTVHKTIHRYTVRAKQGGAQSLNDSAKGTAHSAGAALRRYNERTLRTEIGQLLVEWADHLAATPLIFIRCATYQRGIFLGDGGLLARNDPRLRSIPFETRRPTVDEVKRTWNRLATVTDHGDRDSYLDELEKKRNLARQRVTLQRKKKEQQRVVDVVEDSSDEEDADGVTKQRKEKTRKTDHLKPETEPSVEEDRWPLVDKDTRNRLYDAIREQKGQDLKECLGTIENAQNILSYLNERRFSPNGSSFLHIASSRGLETSLQLLLELGCDPGVRDDESRVPYVVSMNKPIKKVFVQFRADNPKRWQWNRCQIPEPVEQTEEQLAREAEKKKDKKNRQKERLKEKKETEKKIKDEQAAKDAYLALPEREKRARAAEARLKALEASSTATDATTSSARCCQCASPLPSVPFTYNDVMLCSPSCVAAHRTKMSSST